MNQFKKAKMKSLESGHDIESVSGLQTAGIQQENKTPDQEEKKEVVIEKEPKPEIEKIEVPVPEEQKTNQTVSEPVQAKQELEEEIIQEKAEPVIVEQVTKPKQEIAAPVQREEPISPVPIAVPTRPTVQPVVIEEPVIQEPIYAEPQPVTYTYTEPVRTGKKAMPNIFAPKDEAKSMRKSLVLKPTSVRKAETYCAKNGGSFNELVQTLLDNFIDEYGL